MNLKRLTTQLSRIKFSDASIFILISVALTMVLVLRAILVPMAHDEIATFYYFVQSGHVSPFLSNIDTNNHFLNSMLTWVFYSLFGPSPLALRLSNLVFAPVFFYFLYKISQRLRSRLLRFAFFISLAFTLHFIEFLALSRGYGMSMALLLGSIFYLLKGLRTHRQRCYIFSLLLIFVASTANLALINSYTLILVFISVSLYYNIPKYRKSNIAVLLFLGLIPFSLILTQIFYIKAHAGLIAGSPDNFWTTTIISLFAYLFESSHGLANALAAVLFSLVAITGFLEFYPKKTIKYLVNSKAFLFLYLFAGNIAFILLLGILLKVNYPDDRIGIYLYPLAIGSLIFLADQLFYDKKWLKAAVLPFLLIPIHFFIYLNTSYSIWYKYDVIPHRFYTQVMNHSKSWEIPPTIAGHGMRIFCWSYLDYLHGGVSSPVFFTHFPDYNADFQIVNLKMIPGWHEVYDTIDYDAVSERYLLKIRNPFIINQLIQNLIPPDWNTKKEFVSIGEGKADTLRNKNIRVDFRFSLYAAKKPFNGRLVFDVWDKDHKSLRYEYIQLNWLRNDWNGVPGNFVNCMLVYKIPPEATDYKIYIWNIDKDEFDLKKGIYTINELKPATETQIQAQQ